MARRELRSSRLKKRRDRAKKAQSRSRTWEVKAGFAPDGPSPLRTPRLLTFDVPRWSGSPAAGLASPEELNELHERTRSAVDSQKPPLGLDVVKLLSHPDPWLAGARSICLPSRFTSLLWDLPQYQQTAALPSVAAGETLSTGFGPSAGGSWCRRKMNGEVRGTGGLFWTLRFPAGAIQPRDGRGADDESRETILLCPSGTGTVSARLVGQG